MTIYIYIDFMFFCSEFASYLHLEHFGTSANTGVSLSKD